MMAADPAPARLSDLAARLDLPKSATHRLLQELGVLGWVEQGDDGLYRLTVRFALLGHSVLRASRLPDLVAPILDRLAAQTQELVRLTLATEHGLAWFASAQGAPPGLLYQPEMAGPLLLHATANGKAYLATLDDPTALRLAGASGLGRLRPTARTLDTDTALLADLALIRTRGYALADEEAEPGVAAVSVAVSPAHGPAVGTLSAAGPSLRFGADRIPVLAEQLRAAARSVAAAWPLQHPTRKAVS